MPKIMLSLSSLAVLLVFTAAPAQAQLARTFVSAASGNDSNDCNRPTPCRTFQGAHDKTFDQGEISVLDTGGYGALTITKSISVVNDAGEASILVSGGAIGLTINALTADYVNLRGITIQGIGFGGGSGLRFNSGYSLTITNCTFRNHTGNGIVFAPSTNITNLSISNTLVADNGGSGILVLPTGPGGPANTLTRIVVDGVKMFNNSVNGMLIDGNQGLGLIKATVADSVSANNGNHGFAVFSQAGSAIALLTLTHSVVANNNGTALVGFGGPTAIRFGQSTISANGATWSAGNGSLVQSFGDNYIISNGDADLAPPVIARK